MHPCTHVLPTNGQHLFAQRDFKITIEENNRKAIRVFKIGWKWMKVDGIEDG